MHFFFFEGQFLEFDAAAECEGNPSTSLNRKVRTTSNPDVTDL